MNKPAKTTNLIIAVKGEEFVYDQVVIVSKHAPLVSINIGKIQNVNQVGNEMHGGNNSLSESIIRVVKYPEGFYILTGRNAVQASMYKAPDVNGKVHETIMVRLVSIPNLNRCLVPPKVLTGDELKQQFADLGIDKVQRAQVSKPSVLNNNKAIQKQQVADAAKNKAKEVIAAAVKKEIKEEERLAKLKERLAKEEAMKVTKVAAPVETTVIEVAA